MPAFTLEATANSGTNDSWTLGAGSSKWAAMADGSDATYIQKGASVARQGFVAEDLPGEAVTIIGVVTLNVRGKDVTNTGDTVAGSIRYSGTDYDTAAIDFSTSIVNRTKTLSDLSGTPFTVAILNASEVGVNRLQGTANTINVYKLFLSGNYGVGAGGFAFLVVGLIGAMLGGGIVMGDMPGIIAAVQQADPAHSLISREESVQVYAELKAHPFRRYF